MGPQVFLHQPTGLSRHVNSHEPLIPSSFYQREGFWQQEVVSMTAVPAVGERKREGDELKASLVT